MGNSYVLAKARKGNAPRPFEPASEPQKRIFLRHLIDGDGVGASRKAASLTWAQYKHALANDLEFAEAHQDIDSYFLHKLQDVAESMALKGDGAMIRWLLENLWSEKFGKKSKVEHSHRFQSIDEIKALGDDEIEAFCESLGYSDAP